MKFPSFEYVAPDTVAEAVGVAAADEDAKYLAGGQSLLPLLALRLARPTTLIDLQHLGLESVALAGGELRLGAMTRHRIVEQDSVVRRAAPLLAEAAPFVGHGAIRNRGTIGGSLAHADPAAELPTVAVALGARVEVTGPAGSRSVEAADLAEGFFTTTLEPGELVTSVVIPQAGPRHGAAWCEWAPRSGDFALAGAGVAVELGPSGTCERVMAAVCGVAGTPLVFGDVLTDAAACVDAPPASLLSKVSDVVSFNCRAGTGADDDDRAELAGLLAARAFKRAFDRARLAASSEAYA